MKEDFKKTYFYCDIKNEEIFFGDRHYKVPIGSISKFISESDDDWVSIAKELRKIRFKLNEIKSDMDSHKPQQELCNDGEIRVLYDEHELLPEHIDFDMAGYLSGTGENFINYLNLIESIKNLRTGNEESLLRELIFILPIQEKNHVCELKLRHNSVFYYEKVEFLEEDVLPCKNEEEIPNYPNMIDNNSIDIIGHLRESSIWCDLIKLLYTKCELEFIDYLFYNEGILERTIEYIDALLSELFEFQTLKNNIRYATGIDLLKRISPSSIDEFSEYVKEVACPIEVNKEKSEELFPDLTMRKGYPLYHTTSLISMIWVEMKVLKKSYFSFKKCKICGKYFASTNHNASYCKYPNYEYKGIPCQHIWKRPTSTDVAELARMRHDNYRKYEKWQLRTRKNSYKYFESIKLGIEKAGLNVKDELNNINNEIIDKYNIWCKESLEALTQYRYKDGDIKREMLLKIIEIPEIENRSIILSYWRKIKSGKELTKEEKEYGENIK